MKKLSAFIFLLAVLLGVMQPAVGWADRAAVEKILREGGIFRIKNRGSNRYMTLFCPVSLPVAVASVI